jgi:hypothetical protein
LAAVSWFIKMPYLERLKKYCSHLEREFFGFWRGFGEGAGLKKPVTEPKRLVRHSLGEGGSQNQKRQLVSSILPNGFSIFENALRIQIFAFIAAVALFAGCTQTPQFQGAAVDNDQNVLTGGPITGTTIDDLPNSVKNALSQRVPHAEIAGITKTRADRHATYKISFIDADTYPPLRLRDDGQVLPEQLTEQK